MEQLKLIIARTFASEERKTELEKYLVPVRFPVFTAELSSGSSAGLSCIVLGRSGTSGDDFLLLLPPEGHPHDRGGPQRGRKSWRNPAKDDAERKYVL